MVLDSGTVTTSEPKLIDCDSENIVLIRLLDEKEYKQLHPCRNFEFFLPGNLTRYISEFSIKNVFSHEFFQQTNITGNECTRMYEFILESTRMNLTETTMSTIDLYYTNPVHFGATIDPSGLGSSFGIRGGSFNEDNTDANSIQANYLHFLNFVLTFLNVTNI